MTTQWAVSLNSQPRVKIGGNQAANDGQFYSKSQFFKVQFLVLVEER